MKDTIKLGRIVSGEANRDAIHMALAPVVAAEQLLPGNHVGLTQDGEAELKQSIEKCIGIVDPFLRVNVKRGERFWLLLYPGTITGLRHEWAHPAFGKEEAAICDKAKSVKWVTEYAQRHCHYDAPDEAYDRFMERVNDGEIFYHGSDLHSSGDVEDAFELYGHLSIILGRPVGREEFTFSCSC